MPNRSKLPAVYTDASADWAAYASPNPGWLEVFDVTYLHFHNTLELGYCTQGQGACYVEDGVYPFRAGDVQVIFPFQRHLSKSLAGQGSRWYWMNIDPVRMLSLWGMGELGDVERMLRQEMALCGIFSPEKYPEIALLVKKLLLVNHGACPAPPHRKAYLSANLYLLILELAAASAGKPRLELQQQRGFAEILPAVDAISAAIEQGTVPKEARLCTLCGMSSATLRRMFHSVLGQSVRQYIAGCRMRKAGGLLLFTRQSILEIALAVGFEDTSGFVRAFTAANGCGPSAYRRLHAAWGGSDTGFAAGEPFYAHVENELL